MKRVFVLTSDKYILAIRPFAYLFNKYFGSDVEVVVGGFTPPTFDLPHNFSFHSIGAWKDYPVDRWSDGLIKFLNDMPDDVFMFFLEDMWIVRPVYREVVSMACDYMDQFKYVARLDLTTDRLHAGGVSMYGKLGHVKLVHSDPNSQYHLSTMPALWRKEHLLRVLIPNETPWQVEISGTPRLGNLRHEVIVLGTDANPVNVTLAFRAQQPGKLLLDQVAPSDVEEMRKLGLLEGLE